MASDFTPDPRPTADLEREARKVMEQRASRAFDEAEWKRMRAKVMEFAAILREWEEQATASAANKQKN